MAVNFGDNEGAGINVRFSAFLGTMYLSNQEQKALIDQVQQVVPAEDQKKGFTGTAASGSTGKAKTFLRENGFKFVNSVSGVLSSASIRDVEGEKGVTHKYLNVMLKDGDEKIYISAPIANSGVQMLARKLVNARPGVQTDLALFSTYDGTYANHSATLKQGGEEVKGVDPRMTLQPMVQAALDALKAAGVPESDKATYGKRRSAVSQDYHVDLITKQVRPGFDAYYGHQENQASSRPAAASSSSNSAAPAAAKPASSGGWDDFDSTEIPF